MKYDEIKNTQDIENSLTDLTENLISNIPNINKSNTMRLNNRYELLFNNRQLLSEMYVEHGLVQTLIDQPVQDALRDGVEIISNELSPEEIEELIQEFERPEHKDGQSTWGVIQDTIKWGRLFGGSGIVIIDNGNPEKPFFPNSVNEKTKFTLYPADLWELNMQFYENNPNLESLPTDTPYNFYGTSFHKTRVIKYKNKSAPSFMRRRMRGWGMTELERLVRSLNQYIKNQNVIFELLDEAKIDVYKIQGFNAGLLASGGTNKIQTRVQMSNMLKSFLQALVMDTEDDYDQKQMNFSGLGEMLTQIRQGVAADLKMPITKLFGVSSAGFNSGEDDIENYNSMVENEIRAKIKPLILEVIKLYCQKLFGYIPEDLSINFYPLRILSAEQEENVKNSQFNRIIQALSLGVITPEEAKQAINKENLLPIEIDESNELQEQLFLGGGANVA